MAKESKPTSRRKNALQAFVPFLKLKKLLGEGGNGVVYSATDNSDGSKVAIKFFLNVDPRRFERFKDEVLVVTTRLKGNAHVVPIIRSELGLADNSISGRWYTMPIATPLRRHVDEMSWIGRLNIMADLAQGLDSLHARDVAHRDLKPENMLVMDASPRFADFGIAKFPESAGLTKSTEPMGPAGYIAPEMLRDSDQVDARKADIYSFAKSTWAILTSNTIPFVGQYTSNHPAGLRHAAPIDFVYESLDELLQQSTDPDPSVRPSAATFALRLRAVIEQQENFEAANAVQWIAAEREALLLPGLRRTRWEGLVEIVAIINVLSRRRGLNHCFFPDGGGQDVSSAKACEVDRMISLMSDTLGTCYVIKPKSLTLEMFPDNPDLNYAVLETEDVEPLGVRERTDFTEELLQLSNGADYARSVQDGESGFPSARLCCRYFKGGRFVLAPKMGLYNRLDSYTGAWNSADPDTLRSQFEKIARSRVIKTKASFLKRIPMLLMEGGSEIPPFQLRYLGADNLETLLEFEAVLSDTKAPASSPQETAGGEYAEAVFESSKPLNSQFRGDAVKFLESLSDEQICEYLALTYLGRGDIQVDEYEDQLLASGRRHHVNYLRGLLGNGYLRRALQRLGFVPSSER